MGSAEKSFLWHLFHSYWILHDCVGAKKLAEQESKKNLQFPDDIVELVNDLAAKFQDDLLNELAIISLKQRYLEPVHCVTLLGLMYQKKVLSAQEMISYLLYGDLEIKESAITPEMKRVIDVAWLINEDLKDGIMGAEDDDLLSDAVSTMIKNT